MSMYEFCLVLLIDYIAFCIAFPFLLSCIDLSKTTRGSFLISRELDDDESY